MMAANVGKVAKVVEWLGNTGASRHVYNDLSLMQDVRTREKPILLRQLVGDIHVYTTGIVQLDCSNNSGGIQEEAQSSAFSTLATSPTPKSTSSVFRR